MKIDYDKYIVAFSGGKDSTASFLSLLDQGVPKEKIELWHHLIDGSEEEDNFMDWEVTADYCRKFAQSFGVPIYFSWKQGGFKREMLRNNEPTAPTHFETPNGVVVVGGDGPNGTRLKFPQITASLSTRWCSAYLKIDVCSAAIRNQERFRGIKTLLMSGERGEESPARAMYNAFEVDRSDLRDGKRYQRHVDRSRNILYWPERRVWDIIEKYGVVVHPCYFLGFSRCSCKHCIFGTADQFASADFISPTTSHEMADLEKEFGFTLKRNISIPELISKGTVYKEITSESIRVAISHKYTGVIITTRSEWELPAGAYGTGCGPT